MWTRPGSRAHTGPVFFFAGIIALGGCGAASLTPTPGDPMPSAVRPALTHAPSLGASTPGTPLDPASAAASPAAVDSWIRLDDLSVPREDLTALELRDGRVLVIDATYNVISDLGGGPTPPGPTDILDPESGHWTQSAPLNAPRSAYFATRLDDGRVLVTGGDNGWYGAYSSTKLFDPATGRWSSTGLLSTARKWLAGALLEDGRVLVAGGSYSEGYQDDEDFRSGRDLRERALTSSEIYDPDTGRWTQTGSLHDQCDAGAAHVLSDGRVITVGDVAETYDPDTGAWAVAGAVGQEALAQADGSAWVWLADDTLLIIGGGRATDDQRAVATVWRYDPETNTTVEVAPLPGARMGSAAVRLLDGRVLVVGGMERWRLGSGHLAPPTATAFLYDPALDRWTETAPMPFADSPGQATLLSDGSVLVVGGSIPNPDAEVMTDVSSSNPVGWTARFVPSTATGD